MAQFNPKRGFYAVVFVVVMFGATAFLSQKPYYNWDLFPYMAIVMNDPAVPFDSVHARVYREAAASMSVQDFQAISSRQPVLKSNPTAFRQVLKFFQTKPLYNAIVWMSYGAGVNSVVATYLPSLICYFLTGCLLFWWISGMLPLPLTCLGSWTFMALPFMVDASRLSSPDMLCAFIQLGGLYILCEFAILPGLAISLLAILARPDAIILALMIAVALFKTGKISFLAFATFVISGLVISLWLGGDLLKEFLFTASDYSPGWTLTQMWQHYLASLSGGLSGTSMYMVAFILLGFATIFIRTRIHPRPPWMSDHWLLLVCAAMVTLPLRYLVHPALEDRFLIPCYLIITLGFLHSLSLLLRPTSVRLSTEKTNLPLP